MAIESKYTPTVTASQEKFPNPGIAEQTSECDYGRSTATHEEEVMDVKTLMRLNLKRIMDEKGLKQNELAAMMGVKPSVVSNMIRGERAIGSRSRQKIITALGIAPQELYRPPYQATIESPEYPVVALRDAIKHIRILRELQEGKMYVKLYLGKEQLEKLYLKVDAPECVGEGVSEGDDLLVDFNAEPKNGDLVWAVIERVDKDHCEGCVARFYQHDDSMELRPLNHACKGMFLKRDEVPIIHPIVLLRRKLRTD